MGCVRVFLQLTRDFIEDCKRQIAGYFHETAESDVDDYLTEDIIQHAAILVRCNAAANMQLYQDSAQEIPLCSKHFDTRLVSGFSDVFRLEFLVTVCCMCLVPVMLK